MRKITIATVLGVLLSGCSTARMPELSQYQTEFVPYASAEAVSAVTFSRPGTKGNLPQCIAEIVSNQGETLSDSAGSFFGTYTGNYYSAHNATQASGGKVIEYVASDSGAVVASGSVRYQVNALVARSVRFKLSAKQGETGRIYRFGSLQQAQLDSGVAANNGYNPIGSWAGANPDLAVKSLNYLVDQIDGCLAR